MLSQIIMPMLITLAFALFLHGFFPIKHNLPGFAMNNPIPFLDGEITQPDKMFDKVVVILIDALRADFVFEKDLMPFLEAKQKSGNSRHFTLRAHPPTVTLPRIKAMTTGSIPGFIDMVLNFESREMGGDNIIIQAYKDQRRIVFYGDDTWIKLFPHHFTDSDGTTSFFVTDYTEVDDNVTRHIDDRLSALDWDLMILHYLGLDHIGHTAGPNSPLVPTKLSEMNGIIEDLYNSLAKKGEDFVILVCGDHGMSDQGSHGGASDREVFVPAVFMSPKYKQTETRWRSSRELLQIDLAPTLSILMGIPIPINNLGQALIGALDGYTDTDKLNLLFINCQQVLHLMEKNVPDFIAERSYDMYTHAVRLHKSYVTNVDSQKPNVAMVIRAYETAMDAMATKIAKSLTTYDMYAMIMAVSILTLCLLNMTICIITTTELHFDVGSMHVLLLVGMSLFGHVTVCTSQSYSSSGLCGKGLHSLVAVTLVWLTVIYITSTTLKSLHGYKRAYRKPSCIEALLLFGTVVHSLSFLSSSFVEEEHQTWYFLSMTLYLLVIVSGITKSLSKQCDKNSKDLGTKDDICVRKFGDIHNGKAKDRFDKYDKLDEKCDKFDDKCDIFGDNCETHDDKHDKFADNYGRNEDITNRYYSQRGRLSQKSQLKKESGDNYLYTKGVKPSNGNAIEDQMMLADFKVNWKLLPWRQMVSTVTVMVLGRCLRSVNQTGNKWLDTPDLGDWLVRPENEDFLSYITVISLLVIGLAKVRKHSVITVLFVLGLAGCFCYRISTGTVQNVLMIPGYKERSKGISEAYFVYGIIFLMNFTRFIQFIWNKSYNPRSTDSPTMNIQEIMETLQMSWIILITLLLRPHNVILVAMVVLQEQLLWEQCITKLVLPVWAQTLMCWWIGQATFYYQGNSNSMSTIDVSAGYVGLQEYQPVLVATLLYCSTYAGPIFWLMTLLKSLVYHAGIQQCNQSTEGVSKKFGNGLSECIQTLSLERALTLCVYCIVVTVERYHLFVWTVFSPKLLYEGMVTLTYLLFSIILGLVKLISI